MSQIGNNPEQVGGEYMVQDRDHMVDFGQRSDKAKTGRARQAEQGQNETAQQAGGKKGDKARRQAH